MPPGNENCMKSFRSPASSWLMFGIDLAVGAFEVGVAHDRRAAVPGAGDVDHVEVVFLDDPVQVHVDEVLPGRRAPVPQQHVLHVRERQRPLQQRIVVEIDLADRQIVGGAPVGVHPCGAVPAKEACPSGCSLKRIRRIEGRRVSGCRSLYGCPVRQSRSQRKPALTTRRGEPFCGSGFCQSHSDGRARAQGANECGSPHRGPGETPRLPHLRLGATAPAAASWHAGVVFSGVKGTNPFALRSPRPPRASRNSQTAPVRHAEAIMGEGSDVATFGRADTFQQKALSFSFPDPGSLDNQGHAR